MSCDFFQMTDLSKFQLSRAIGEMEEGKMNVQVTREMFVTKFVITMITQKPKVLGKVRLIISSHGDTNRIVRDIKSGPSLTSFKMKKMLKSTNFLSGRYRRHFTKFKPDKTLLLYICKKFKGRVSIVPKFVSRISAVAVL